MGVNLPYYLLAGSQIGSAALGGALQNDPYQHKQSFEGTGADPVSWMSDLRASLGNVLGAVSDRANEDVGVGGDMELSLSPSFSADSGLPWDISGPQMTTPKRVSVKGFNIGQVGNGASESLPLSAWTGGRTPPNTPANKAAAQKTVQHNIVDDKRLPQWYRDRIQDQLPPMRTGDYAMPRGADPNDVAPPTEAPTGVPSRLPPASPMGAPTHSRLSESDPAMVQGLAAARLLQHALGAAA